MSPLVNQWGQIDFGSQNYLAKKQYNIPFKKVYIACCNDLIGVKSTVGQAVSIAYYDPESSATSVAFISSSNNIGGAFYFAIGISN